MQAGTVRPSLDTNRGNAHYPAHGRTRFRHPQGPKALRSAGFDDAQAEAVISTVGDAVGGNVSTKADLQELRAEMKTDLQELRAEMKTDLQELRAEMKTDLQDLELRVMDKFESLYKHLWAMSVGIVTAVVALTKLLS